LFSHLKQKEGKEGEELMERKKINGEWGIAGYEEEWRLGSTTEIQEPYAKNAVGKSGSGERAEER